jgi:23S rRNA pseudouridine1911/1915/1917 synthase
VLYEDNHLVAVFKPPGLLTQSDQTGDISLLEVTKAWLKEKYKKPGNVFLGLVHRLDRPVSGAVIFAKTSKAASRISESFRTRTLKKRYQAIVEGIPKQARGELRHLIDWGENNRAVLHSVDSNQSGKAASLDYRVMRRGRETSLIAVDLHTGRKHQIRAQLASIGHPILGDHRYGAKLRHQGPLALICCSLEIAHPTRREEILRIEVPESLFPIQEWLR